MMEINREIVREKLERELGKMIIEIKREITQETIREIERKRSGNNVIDRKVILETSREMNKMIWVIISGIKMEINRGTSLEINT